MNSSFCILGAVDLIAVLIGCLIFPPAKNKWVQQAKIVADNEAASEEFGRAIAIKGNTAAIAAPCDSVPSQGEPKGTVHIYSQLGKTWSLQAKLFVPQTQTGSYSFFGSSVAIDGNTVLIAADSLNVANSSTPLYVFTRSSDRWHFQAQLELPAPPQSPIYYQSVALAGDTAVAATKGKVYIFRRHSPTGTWAYEAELKSCKPDYHFGDTVAIDGNTIVVSGGDRGCASAYVFVRSATGGWLQQAELTPRRRDVGYSNAIAFSGNTVIIGTPGENLQQGAAYVFERNPATGGWVQQTRLVPRDLPPFFAYGFGASVAIDGDAIVVGSATKTLTNVFGFTWNQGGAYVYVRAPVKGGWSQPTKLLPQANEQVTHYGEVVSISGDRVMVTAGESNNTAYIFKRVNSQ